MQKILFIDRHYEHKYIERTDFILKLVAYQK